MIYYTQLDLKSLKTLTLSHFCLCFTRKLIRKKMRNVYLKTASISERHISIIAYNFGKGKYLLALFL